MNGSWPFHLPTLWFSDSFHVFSLIPSLFFLPFLHSFSSSSSFYFIHSKITGIFISTLCIVLLLSLPSVLQDAATPRLWTLVCPHVSVRIASIRADNPVHIWLKASSHSSHFVLPLVKRRRTFFYRIAYTIACRYFSSTSSLRSKNEGRKKASF